MRAIVLTAYGDGLQLQDLPSPTLKPGSVRIKVNATGINFADILMRNGRYPEAPPLPFIPGYEVGGDVVEVAPDVDVKKFPWLKPGARVMAVTKFSGYAEEIVTPAVKTCPLPDEWSYAQGAAFLINYVTAYLGVAAMARVNADDRVLVHGIAGGVGLAAMQIARAHGARVAGTCSAQKATLVREQGADEVWSTDNTEWISAVNRWSDGGPTIIVEPRGGSGLKESLDLVRPLGSVVVCGFSEIMSKKEVDPAKAEFMTGRLLWFNPLTLIERNVGIFMLNIMTLWDTEAIFLSVAQRLMDGITHKHFNPIIHQVLPFDQFQLGHQMLENRENIGKVVLAL